ncbi:molybdopterin synthase catalytic subunit MoaE [Neptunicella sp.]|uniref:molybdopterin synthase catalytic subunit MoaE n=1 Tax=Neptunicella sp. TaxID=2125986 RepID=UPI003F68F67D
MISIQIADFDVGGEYQALKKAADGDGAIVIFTGVVRDLCSLGSVNGVNLEHYPGMAEKSLMEICSQARQRWSLGQLRIIHRVGELMANEQIVFVGVTSKHRRDAFDACEFLMDYLKTRAPIWKKELTSQGGVWVEAKALDDDYAARWK